MEHDPPGLPLSRFVAVDRCAGVRFFCNGCALTTDVDAQKVIDRLNAKGIQGESVGIRVVARLATKPCKRCGGREFQTSPAWV